MTSVVLVHGTGVREPAYTALLDHVTSQIASITSKATVLPCRWGKDHGTELHLGGKSIPDYDLTRALQQIDPADEAALRWDLLNQDPLLELRVLGAQEGPGRMLGADAPADDLAAAAAALTPAGDLEAALGQAGLSARFLDARDAVVTSDVFRGAVAASGTQVAELRAATARAIVATLIRTTDAALMSSDGNDGTGILPVWTLAGPLRDRIVDLIMDQLGGAERGLFDLVGRQVVGLVSWYGTRKVQRKRGAVTDAASPAAGDILYYQSRGKAIRDYIAREVRKPDGDVIIIAHSLGGIACVDLLVMEQIPGVKLLVTVGSQAPYLYELGALVSLEWNQPLPDHFPPWLNIYDPRDFLSYLAAPVFGGGGAGVRDVEVDNREAFPRAHSAYWSNPAVWKAIGEAAQWP